MLLFYLLNPIPSQVLAKNLRKSPSTLEDLKFVLATIAEIRTKSLVMELRYQDVQERYRTLGLYHIIVSQFHSLHTSSGCLDYRAGYFHKMPRGSDSRRKVFILVCGSQGIESSRAGKELWWQEREVVWSYPFHVHEAERVNRKRARP